MAAYNNPAYPNCDACCDRCGSPLLPLNCIYFKGVSKETGKFVQGVFGPDCIYHLTGDKNPRYHMIDGVYDPEKAAAKRAERAKAQAESDEAVAAEVEQCVRRILTLRDLNWWIVQALLETPCNTWAEYVLRHPRALDFSETNGGYWNRRAACYGVEKPGSFIPHGVNGFVYSICHDLMNGTAFHGLYERAQEIVAEIYAKQYGRRNSKAYNAAYEEFWNKAGEGLE